MIAFLKGKLVESLPTRVIIEVQGIGYEVFIPLSTYEKLPAPASDVYLLTHHVIREDDHLLYGFLTKDEKDLFSLLIKNVSGVGPKVALALLSGCTPAQFRSAVVARDLTFLSKIKGLGKKTAERIFVELKDKVGVSDVWAASESSTAELPPEQHKVNDALLALITLGYKQQDALKAIQQLEEKEDVQVMIRESLKKLQ